jgi:hypothetical protein
VHEREAGPGAALTAAPEQSACAKVRAAEDAQARPTVTKPTAHQNASIKMTCTHTTAREPNI